MREMKNSLKQGKGDGKNEIKWNFGGQKKREISLKLPLQQWIRIKMEFEELQFVKRLIRISNLIFCYISRKTQSELIDTNKKTDSYFFFYRKLLAAHTKNVRSYENWQTPVHPAICYKEKCLKERKMYERKEDI